MTSAVTTSPYTGEELQHITVKGGLGKYDPGNLSSSLLVAHFVQKI